MKNLTFNEFCQKHLDGMYEPRLPQDKQCSGYLLLKKMVVENITPASLKEMNRWETNPTLKEISSMPDIKYLRFLHPILRPLICNNWETIKKMKVS